MNIGIDLINVNELPIYDSFSEQRFYFDNFSKNEIEYAISKNNKDSIFAYLFSIKESIVKSEKNLIYTPFNKIEISIIKNKFFYKNFLITCSSLGKNWILVSVINKY